MQLAVEATNLEDLITNMLLAMCRNTLINETMMYIANIWQIYTIVSIKQKKSGDFHPPTFAKHYVS